MSLWFMLLTFGLVIKARSPQMATGPVICQIRSSPRRVWTGALLMGVAALILLAVARMRITSSWSVSPGAASHITPEWREVREARR